MATRFCSHCGQPLLSTSSFCSSCGVALGAPRYSAAASLYQAAPPSTADDRGALSSIMMAAILALIGAILSILGLVVLPTSSLLSVSVVGSSTSVSLNESVLYGLVALSVGGLVLGLLELWLYRQAFQTLASQDRTFATPATLVLLAFISLFLIAALGGGLLAAVFEAIACAGAGNPVPSSCVDVGALLTLTGLLAVVAIMALVGLIGLLVGIWRLGTRYGEGMFQVGAILLIFPVLNLIGSILILVGVRSTRGRLQHQPLYGS